MAELRQACALAVSTLPAGHRVIVLAAPVGEANARRGVTEPLGHRVAAHLLDGVPFEAQLALPYAAAALLELDEPTTLVVMADGSARRGEKAPGHLHPDAVAFDERIEAALRSGDAEALAALDPEVGEELGARACRRCGCSASSPATARSCRTSATPTRRTAWPGGSPAGT